MQTDDVNNLLARVMVHVDRDVDGDDNPLFVAAEKQLSSASVADAAARSTTLAAIRNKSAASARQELFEISVDCLDDVSCCCIAGLVRSATSDTGTC